MKASITLVVVLAGAALALVTPDPKAIIKRGCDDDSLCPFGGCCNSGQCGVYDFASRQCML